jgi:hypothetical protein
MLVYTPPVGSILGSIFVDIGDRDDLREVTVGLIAADMRIGDSPGTDNADAECHAFSPLQCGVVDIFRPKDGLPADEDTFPLWKSPRRCGRVCTMFRK